MQSISHLCKSVVVIPQEQVNEWIQSLSIVVIWPQDVITLDAYIFQRISVCFKPQYDLHTLQEQDKCLTMLHPQQDTPINETSHLLSQYDHDISSIGLPWMLGPLSSFHKANHSYYKAIKKLPHVICIVKHSVYALSSLQTIPWNNYPKAY